MKRGYGDLGTEVEARKDGARVAERSGSGTRRAVRRRGRCRVGERREARVFNVAGGSVMEPLRVGLGRREEGRR